MYLHIYAQITIEKTPAYFVGESVPKRVHAMNSSVKLILVLRDPVQRAISDYDQLKDKQTKHGQPMQRFEDLVLFSGADGERVNEGSSLIQSSVYHFYLARWLRYFPLRQIHLVNGEQLVKNPLDELQKVERFLKLPARFGQDNIYFNATKGFYCMRGGGDMSDWGAEDMRGEGSARTEWCLDASKGRAHTDVSAEAVEKLRNHFRPHNKRLYQMVGREFGWTD